MVNMLKCQQFRSFAQRICDYRTFSSTQGLSGGALRTCWAGRSCLDNLNVGETRYTTFRSVLPTAETSSVTSQSVLEAVEQRLGPLSKAPSLPPPPPVVIVISGPSGVGKDAVIKALQESRPDLHFVITATSRPQRPGEVHGVDYLFVTREEFEAWIEEGQLLEHALVYGEYKGIPRQQVVDALARGTDVVLRLDIQGAATVRRLIPSAVSIFLVATSEEELVKRLIDRKTELLDKMLVRVETAREETLHIREFDYVVVNQDRELETAVQQINAIISTEKLRVSRLLSQSPPGATPLENQ